MKIKDLFIQYPDIIDRDIVHQKLLEMSFEALSVEDRFDWYVNISRIEYQIRALEQASHHLNAGLKDFPDRTYLHFLFGLVYEKKGNFPTALKYFQQVKKDEISVDNILQIIHYCYIWNEYDAGLAFLTYILNRYKEIRIIDDHYSTMQGMPFYSDIFAILVILAKNSEKLKLVDEEIQLILNYYTDQFQAQYLSRLSQAFLYDKWEPIIQDLQAEVALEDIESPWRDNLLFLKLAIFVSRKQSNYNEGLKLLDEIQLRENESKLLYSCKILAIAELANRFEKINIESRYLKEFLSLNPELLPLPLVFLFGFDKYNEKIKKIYRNVLTNAPKET